MTDQTEKPAAADTRGGFAHFFIDRPVFAIVLSIVITLVGGIAIAWQAGIVVFLVELAGGGTVVGEGTPEDIAANPTSHTGVYLKRVL